MAERASQSISLVRVNDGANGQAGAPGATGPKGDPGATGAQGPIGPQGEPGQNGYTPIKGVDYFDGINGTNGRDGIDGYTPIKGVDYFDGENGTDGKYVTQFIRHYTLSIDVPETTPLSSPSDWPYLTEPEYEKRYIYTQLTSEEGVPEFAINTYYSLSGGEYVLAETAPADWSTSYTDYYTRAEADYNLYYCDVYEWSEGNPTCSGVSMSANYLGIKLANEAAERIDISVEDINSMFDSTVGVPETIYMHVPFANVAPIFSVGMYYELSDNEYVSLEAVPSDWADNFTDYYIVKPFTPLIESMEKAKNDITSVTERLDGNDVDIDNLKTDLGATSGIASSASELAIENAQSIEALNGYISIDAEAPSITLGKKDATGNDKWATEISSIGVKIKSDAAASGEFISEGGKPTLKADNARLANILLRSTNSNNIGVLGIVAQSNGHVSMKEL